MMKKQTYFIIRMRIEIPTLRYAQNVVMKMPAGRMGIISDGNLYDTDDWGAIVQ